MIKFDIFVTKYFLYTITTWLFTRSLNYLSLSFQKKYPLIPDFRVRNTLHGAKKRCISVEFKNSAAAFFLPACNADGLFLLLDIMHLKKIKLQTVIEVKQPLGHVPKPREWRAELPPCMCTVRECSGTRGYKTRGWF